METWAMTLVAAVAAARPSRLLPLRVHHSWYCGRAAPAVTAPAANSQLRVVSRPCPAPGKGSHMNGEPLCPTRTGCRSGETSQQKYHGRQSRVHIHTSRALSMHNLRSFLGVLLLADPHPAKSLPSTPPSRHLLATHHISSLRPHQSRGTVRDAPHFGLIRPHQTRAAQSQAQRPCSASSNSAYAAASARRATCSAIRPVTPPRYSTPPAAHPQEPEICQMATDTNHARTQRAYSHRTRISGRVL